MRGCPGRAGSGSRPGGADRGEQTGGSRQGGARGERRGSPVCQSIGSAVAHPNPDSSAQYRSWLRRSLIAGPGNELVRADEHVSCLIALWAAGAAVADNRKRDLKAIGGRCERATNCLLPVEAQERKARPQPLKDVLSRGEWLRREMMSRARPE